MKVTTKQSLLKTAGIGLLLLTGMTAPVYGQMGGNGGKVYVWSWGENLAGNGPLTFYLNTGDGSAVMVDERGTFKGTFSQTQTTVRIVIADRGVYDGSFLGSTMYGTATDGKATWKWSVQLLQSP